MVIATLSTLLIGYVILLISCLQTSYFLLILGCFIFSIGSDGYFVVSTSIESFWFQQKETAVALSVDSAFSNIFTISAFTLTPKIYKATNSLAWSFSFGVLLAVVSLIGGIILSLFNRYAEKFINNEDNEAKAESTPINCATFKSLGFGYFLIALIYACRTLSYNLFVFISSEYFQIRFGFDYSDASLIMSIPYIAFMIFTTIFGYLVYRFGRKTFARIFMYILVTLALATMCVSMASLCFMDNGHHKLISILPYSIFSIANVVITATVWPSIALLVPIKLYGIAAGVMLSSANLCITIGPVLLGVIHDNTMYYDFGYSWSIAFIIGWLTIGLIASVLLANHDASEDYKLCASEYLTKT